LGVGEATTEHADLDASVEAVERVCQEVRSLVAKVHLTLERVRDMSVPESTSTTMASIIEALGLKEDGEDPLVTAVR
jgi:ADP-dependent phosphofructokinase/glucokinase